MSIFSEYKDEFISKINVRPEELLQFPLVKIGNILNGYQMGEFIVIGGRKTSGKTSFLFHNYVVNPLIAKLAAAKVGDKLDIKVVLIDTKHSRKHVTEKLAVNYLSNSLGGNKISIPSLYGYKGTHSDVTPDEASNAVNVAFNSFNALISKGIFSVFTGNRSISSLEETIINVMADLGTLNEDGEFIVNSKYVNLKTIIAINDSSGIYHSGTSTSRTLLSDLGKLLRTLSKQYGVLIVLVTPSTTFTSGQTHRSSLDEILPMGSYADRAIIMHNPSETYDYKFLKFDIEDFIATSGVCYFRSAYIAANVMGVSNVYVPLLMMPENGFMEELPSQEQVMEIADILEERDIN
ncbi:MAG: hypothetical protein KAH32_06780 [Chlamydiia bacterium]|nr:hypothetical protein [Chlamydiia bacterium]